MTLHSNVDWEALPLAEKRELLRLLEAKERVVSRNKLRRYAPYKRQREFHNKGLTHRERLFMAGNQLGKTLAGGAEVAMHVTGRYPGDWNGRRFDAPCIWIVGSESGELTRDGAQRMLMGPPDREEEWGTGMIPADAILDRTRRMGVPNALDSITVRHASGGASTILFKSYDQGRSKWQANTVHGVWFDEEPPEDVYMEGITRTNATGGSIILTFTPLKGMSAVVARYLLEDSPDRSVTRMTIEDAEHYTPEERQRIIDSYPPHEREARVRGEPTLGSGLIFPVDDAKLIVDPFPIPYHWPQIGAMDFGYDHPFGAVRMAWDRDADVVYVTANYRERQETPITHCAALRPWGRDLPWSWPHDGLQHDKGSGVQLAAIYRDQGLNMLPERATFADGTNGVEAGISDMLIRMKSGRWKVFSSCTEWLEERRLYHRKDGKIVKERDDVISASRYGLMMLRYAVSMADLEARSYDDWHDDPRSGGHDRDSVTGY